MSETVAEAVARRHRIDERRALTNVTAVVAFIKSRSQLRKRQRLFGIFEGV